MANRIVLNETSYHGKGAIKEIVTETKARGFKKAFVCTDPDLLKFNVSTKVIDLLDEANLAYEVYSDIKANPTIANVKAGVEAYKNSGADYIIAIGGGSSIDTAKAVGIIIANPDFEDVVSLEGVAGTTNKAVPIFAVPTTAGTAAEVTINYVITDENKDRKMVCVDPKDIPVVAFVDPDMMSSMPKGLTAATGMDALTHAIETIVTPGAYPVSDATALAAVKIIFDYLAKAVENGQDIEAREQMVYAVFLGGVAFSNAGLGNVHAMAHQLGGIYNLPHGVCNAMLLPYVEEENAKYVPEKFIPIANVLGYDIKGKSAEECAAFVVNEMKRLAKEVGIPETLSELGVNEVDFDLLAENAMKDICAPGNPVEFTKEQIIELYKKIV